MANDFVNERLLDAIREWEERCSFSRVAQENSLSRPFVCSVSERYLRARRRIMIVGQETKDFPLYSDDWPEEHIQAWGVAYLERQLWNVGSGKYNRSAFWKLFRYVEQAVGFCPCWNNVDKAQRVIEGKAVPLTAALEAALNGVFLSSGRTLLQEEIAITRPDALLFITGPYYSQSMAAALGLSEHALDELRPTVDRLCSDVSAVSGLELPVLWTYHPTFLNRNEKRCRCFSRAMEEIRETLDR